MTRTRTMPGKFKGRTAAIAVAVIVLSALGGYWWRSSVRGQIARNALDPAPDLKGANPELDERVREARDQIEHGRQPVEALGTLARLYYANGWLEPADSAGAALLELEPRNPRWPYVLALLRANSGRLDEALPFFLQTIRLAPDYLPARLKAADAMAKLNQTDEAIAMERKVLEKDPANAYAWVGLGNIYVAQKKWDLARDCFQKAVASSGDFRTAWLGLVAVYEANANNDAAAEAWSHVDAVQRSPESPDPWIDSMLEDCYNVYYLRVAAFSSIDVGFARRLLERAVRLQPGDAAAQKDYGMLLFRANDLAAARRSLTLATTLAPADSDTWLSLITLLRAAGDQAGMDQTIRNGLARCPASPGLWLERGRMLARAHAFDEAFAAFAKSAKLEPNEAAPHVESAVAYFQLEQTERALGELKTALTVEPNNPFAQVVMARYAIFNGDKATALTYYRKAWQNTKVLPEDKKQLSAAFEAEFGAPPR